MVVMPAAIPYIAAAASAAGGAASANAAKKNQKNAVSSANNVNAERVQWTPYAGGSLQYYQNPELVSSTANVGNMANSTPAGNQYLTQGGNEVNKVLSDGWQAMSDAYMTKKYENTKSNMQKDFAKQQNQTASRLANSGLTGSGISQATWGDNVNNEKQILANAWQQLQDTNEQQTQSRKQNALSMTPQLAQLSAQLSQQPLENQLRYNTVLQQQNAAQNAVNQYNNQQKWNEWAQQLEVNKTNATNQTNANIAKAQMLAQIYGSSGSSSNFLSGFGSGLAGIK
jgi:hypothetical protein